MTLNEARLQAQARSIKHEADPHTSRAAVLIGVMRGSTPAVILTQRAAHMNSHAGEVAFPGGKRDDDDDNLAFTALREAEEEINLRPQTVEVVAPMPQIITRYGVSVTPFFGFVESNVQLTANANEIAEIFTVPLAWLCEQNNMRVDHYKTPEGERYAPYFLYEGFRIWGATSIMLTRFLNDVFEAQLVVDPSRVDNTLN